MTGGMNSAAAVVVGQGRPEKGLKKGAGTMGTYRVYRLDEIGKIRGVEWLDALDDRYALEAARAIAEPGGCEVWQLARKVGRVALRP